jgi:microcystin-dependent protein
MSSTQQALPKLDTPLVQDSIGTTSDGKIVQVRGGMISIPWYRFLISLWNRTGGGTGAIGISTGAMYVWAGDLAAVPEGLLICDGRQVSRSQFQALFSVIQTKYGAGDGSTTFNLPNIQDKVLIGASGSKPVGSSGGSNSLLLTEAELPVVNATVTDPGHAHLQQVKNTGTAGAVGSQGASTANDTSVGTTDVSTTGISVSFGGGQPADITPAYVAATWVIQS